MRVGDSNTDIALKSSFLKSKRITDGTNPARFQKGIESFQ